MALSDTSPSSRVVPIGEPDTPARHLAYNRALRHGRSLPLTGRLAQARRLIAGAESHEWLSGNRRRLEATFEDLEQVLAALAKASLPLAADGPLVGFPRIFEFAITLVNISPAALEPESIAPFVEEYQSVQPFTMAELWAIDSMLRLAVVEALGRSSADAIPTLITSLKAIESASWQDFFEANSRTEATLRQDPIGGYPRMDFATRDQYRHAVEKIARYSSATEEAVAQAAVELALEAGRARGSAAPLSLREQHVGYHLIDRGAEHLKAALAYRPDWRTRLADAIVRRPTACYLITIELTALAIGAWLLSLLPEHLGYLGLIVFLLATEPAIAFTNSLVTYLLPPRRLPKLDFSEGIPADCITLAVVPTLLLSEKFVDKLLRDLEIRFLANRDARLYFGLLTDFPDTTTPTDELDHLAERCLEGVRQLNRQYGTEHHQPFFLFHRRNEWNPKQATWMGLERKRGKLIALNNLLRNVEDAFHIKAGDLTVLPQVRFVITLDSDTEMPRGAAQQLAGTLAHPLNQAVVDPHWNIVREGYGILQPRVGISIDSARRSALAALYSGQTGYDLYSTAVSDVYQDLFGEGSYVGKGIYDVDVFQRTLARRFPHDLLLSHDLIEGTYARAALVSDIELIDDYPSHYSAWSKRKHRWTRGDWQIMLWLLPRVPDFSGRMVSNPLSILSLWKIADNLRRSLLEIALLLLLLAGWIVLPGGAAYWTAVVVIVTILPVYIGTAFSLLRFRSHEQWLTYLADVWRGFLSGHVEAIFRLIFLPHQAAIMLDAILRSVVRTTVTGRRLLEWESAAQAELGARKVSHFDTLLWLATPISLAALAAILYSNSAGLKSALPFLAAWALSPLIARRLNEPLIERKNRLTGTDTRLLRGVALRTWQFYADFATAEHNWLVPDNVREEDGYLARRISPTNLGLLLNAYLAAADFGFVTRREFLESTERIFATMGRMQRERGHFLNWYDTDSLTPLEPRYVSTVDSGNLAAALIALRQGLLEQTNGEEAQPATADYIAALTDLGLSPERLRPEDLAGQDLTEEQRFWAVRFGAMLRNRDTVGEPKQLTALALRLAAEAGRYVEEMDFSFLLKPKRKLFHTGWNADSDELDAYEYDLLASEARIASFVAIAKNDVPHTHWARLGRRSCLVAGKPALLSWSGTMFEYLMPNLWLKRYPDTLLDQTADAAVKHQRQHGRSLQIPWGISESACAQQVGGDYRYHAFGLPELAGNPEQQYPSVVAPYATILALPVALRHSLLNLEDQIQRGWLTRYGFYEAADFLGGAKQETLVKIFMAHHHGMSLIALCNVLYEGRMQERFHREPMVEATTLLLHERALRHARPRQPDASFPVRDAKRAVALTAA